MHNIQHQAENLLGFTGVEAKHIRDGSVKMKTETPRWNLDEFSWQPTSHQTAAEMLIPPRATFYELCRVSLHSGGGNPTHLSMRLIPSSRNTTSSAVTLPHNICKCAKPCIYNKRPNWRKLFQHQKEASVTTTDSTPQSRATPRCRQQWSGSGPATPCSRGWAAGGPEEQKPGCTWLFCALRALFTTQSAFKVSFTECLAKRGAVSGSPYPSAEPRPQAHGAPGGFSGRSNRVLLGLLFTSTTLKDKV